MIETLVAKTPGKKGVDNAYHLHNNCCISLLRCIFIKYAVFTMLPQTATIEPEVTTAKSKTVTAQPG